MTNVVRPRAQRAQAVLDLAPRSRCRGSRSPRRGSGCAGSARMARAMATRCRWPPESLTPRSPTMVSYLSANRSTNSSQWAIRAASRHLAHRSRRAAVADVLGDRCRRRGSCPAARRRGARGSRAAADVVEVARRRCGSRPLLGRLNAMTRPISVLLPEPLEPTSAVVDPAGAAKETSLSTGTPASYSNETSSNAISPRTSSSDASARPRRPRSVGLHDLADAIEAGERLGDLRADRGDLHDRRGQQAGEEDVHDEVAERHRRRRGWRARRRAS